MSRYIDAEKIPWTDLNDGRGGVNVYVTFLEKVARMPAADVAEVRHGRWKETKVWGGRNFFCSECRYEFTVDTCMMKPIWHYCPNCGALMVNEDD